MFQAETPSARNVVAVNVVTILTTLLSAVTLRAASIDQISALAIDPTSYPDYFTIDETVRINSTNDQVAIFRHTTENLLSEALEILEPATLPVKQLLSLISFVHHNSPVPQAPEKYNRRSHFSSWRSDLGNCLDVRGQVLVRDSKDPVTTRPSGSRCVVDSGRWIDPYAGSSTTDPSDIQIDHLVPLKNAYIMGGFNWSKNKRCWYANFIAVDYHLLSVNGHENMSKSDKTPADYMPPSRSYQCQYVKNWLKVKLTWELELVRPEVDAIKEVVKQNGCSSTELAITADELKQTRADISAGSSLCK